ncbi:MAG: hypothetical protein Q9195_008700 [Heterodermia aff. obscurata]
MQDVAPITNGGSDEDQARGRRDQETVAKWAQLWRTMILASLGKTLFPYSRYIRTLNLQDLEELFRDAKFRDKLNDSFFKGELSHIKVEKGSSYTVKGKKTTQQLDPVTMANRLGEVLIADTPMLEELGGNIGKGALLKWIPKLPRLRNMNIWDGEALRDTGSLIRAHCPNFAELKFWGWVNPDADHAMASFLNEIREQSLKSLETLSTSMIGSESFLALNCHGECLTELHLCDISADAMVNLNLLKECTNLVSLQLSEIRTSTTDLEHRHNDVYVEVAAWLCGCKKLKNIKLNHFHSAPSLLTSLLCEHDIQLIEMELDDYSMRIGKTFHRALVHQRSLQSLCLMGEGDEAGGEGYSILVDSLCKLENLADLRLEGVSDFFNDEHICRLAQNLSKLESFVTTGWGLTDKIWQDLARLKYLKRLDFNAMTSFTARSLLAYVSELGHGNQGFALAVMMADLDFDLKPHEQQLIRNTLTKRVGGSFEFMLLRDIDVEIDPEVSEFENSDSD